MNLKYLTIKLIYHFSINLITPLVIYGYIIIIIGIKNLSKNLKFNVILNNFLLNNLNYIFLKTNNGRYIFILLILNIKHSYTSIINKLLFFLMTRKSTSIKVINRCKIIFKKFNFRKFQVSNVTRGWFINFTYLNNYIIGLFLVIQIFISLFFLLGGLFYIIDIGALFVQLVEVSVNALISIFVEMIRLSINIVLFFSNFFFEKTLLFTTYSARLITFFLNLLCVSEYVFFLLEFIRALHTWSLSLSGLLLASLTFSDELHLFTPPEIWYFDPVSILFRGELVSDFTKSEGLRGLAGLVSCSSSTLLIFTLLTGVQGCFTFFLTYSGIISTIPVFSLALLDLAGGELGVVFAAWWLRVGEIALLFGSGVVNLLHGAFLVVSCYSDILNIFAVYCTVTEMLWCFFTDLTCVAVGVMDLAYARDFLVFFYKLVFGVVFSKVMCVCTWVVGVCTFAAYEFCFSFLCINIGAAWLEALSTCGGVFLDFFILSADFYSGNAVILLNFLKICYNISDFCAGYLGFEPGAVFTYYYMFILIFFGWLANVGRLLSLTAFRGEPALQTHRLSVALSGGSRSLVLTSLSAALPRLFGFRGFGVGYKTRRSSLRFSTWSIPVHYAGWILVRLILYRESLYSINGAKELLCRVRYLKNFYCFDVVWGRNIAYRFLKYFSGYKIGWGLFAASNLTTYPKDQVFFSRLSALGSLPLFSAVCFSDNFFWIGSGGSGLSTFGSSTGVNSLYVDAFLSDVTFNSRFLRELGLTQLRFNERGGWGANSLVGKYFKTVDLLGLSQLDRGGLEYTRPDIFFAATSELSLLNFQFVCHNVFVSIFFDMFSFSTGMGVEGATRDVSHNSGGFSLLLSVYRFLDSIVPVSVVTATLTLLITPFSVFFLEFVSIVFAVSEVETLFTGDDSDRLELARAQNSIFFLKNLIGGVLFTKEDKLLAFAQQRVDNQTWWSNPFFAWRWLYLFRRPYRLLSGMYDYPRILRGDLPRQIRYAANIYESFELLPEFFYPLGLFIDSAALSLNFGLAPRAGLSMFSSESVPSLHAFSLKTGRAKARTLFLSNSMLNTRQFNLSEVKYRKLYLEFSGRRLLRRYNYFFSELDGLNWLGGELPAVGRWGVDSSLYDKFSKHFASNYWGKKQAFSLKFLEYEKYQYLKKLKLDFLGSAYGYLSKLQHKINLARDSTLRRIDSTRRDRLVHQLTFFFLTVYDEFVNVTGTSESKYANVQLAWLRQAWSLLYDELFGAGIVYVGRLSPLFFYVSSVPQYLLFFGAHFFLKLCSFFSHVGVLPYLPFSYIMRRRILELSMFAEFDQVVPVKLFRLYVLRTNTLFFGSKCSFDELCDVTSSLRICTKV